jgi:uncharacterized membrane protein
LLCCSLAHAAEITGVVYDYTLKPMPNVVVSIDTYPKQQILAKDGNYSLQVPPGAYTLSARYEENGVLKHSTEENITVEDEGRYNLDLILFPVISSELTEPVEIVVNPGLDQETKNWSMGIALLLFFAFLGFAFWFLKNRSPGPVSEDDTYNQVLEVIRLNKRVTQKEIRSKVPVSEAKISLVIAEMEEQGIVKKYRKGRGNIIVLK